MINKVLLPLLVLIKYHCFIKDVVKLDRKMSSKAESFNDITFLLKKVNYNYTFLYDIHIVLFVS